MPTGPTDEDHVLLQTRAVASVGIIGVGGGIGLSLVLSRILIVLGLAIAIGSALCVFWIYWSALKSAYRAITKRISYQGPRVQELLIANVAAVLLIGIALTSFSIVVAQKPPTGRATLDLIGIQYVKIPATASNGFINIEIKNQGSLDADKGILLIGGLTTTTELTADTIRNHLSAASAVFDKIDPKEGNRQLRVSAHTLITPRDVSTPNLWSNIDQRPGMAISDAQWQEFEQAKRSIYVFYIALFQDEGHETSYWKTINCVYWVGTTAFWHNCAGNRVDLVPSK
jgi:hypothetical protein